jgi:hypothetical protein
LASRHRTITPRKSSYKSLSALQVLKKLPYSVEVRD